MVPVPAGRRQLGNTTSPLLLNPPKGATRADLVLAFGQWFVTYWLPMGQIREDLDQRALAVAIGNRPHVDAVTKLVEEHFRTALRDPARITGDTPLTVVAAWSLVPTGRRDG